MWIVTWGWGWKVVWRLEKEEENLQMVEMHKDVS